MKNLIIRPQGIGDIVLMIPALRSLFLINSQFNPHKKLNKSIFKS